MYKGETEVKANEEDNWKNKMLIKKERIEVNK